MNTMVNYEQFQIYVYRTIFIGKHKNKYNNEISLRGANHPGRNVVLKVLIVDSL